VGFVQPKWRQPGPSSESRGNCLRTGQAHGHLHSQPAQGEYASLFPGLEPHRSFIQLIPLQPFAHSHLFPQRDPNFAGSSGSTNGVPLGEGGIGTQEYPAASCTDLAKMAHFESGNYWLQPSQDVQPFQGYCDMEREGGGWLMCATTQHGWHISSETQAGGVPFGSDGYRSDCRNVPFNQVCDAVSFLLLPLDQSPQESLCPFPYAEPLCTRLLQLPFTIPAQLWLFDSLLFHGVAWSWGHSSHGLFQGVAQLVAYSV